jgi:hypothetical protein
LLIGDSSVAYADPQVAWIKTTFEQTTIWIETVYGIGQGWTLGVLLIIPSIA